MPRAAVAAIAIIALVGCAGGEEHGDLLIRADRLFDGERVIEPGAVLIRGDEIVAVGEKVEAGAEQTIELGDATILPGFIDLHVHVLGDPRMVRGGVTTVRDLGHPIETLVPTDDEWPVRVLHAGPIVTAPGGYPVPVWGDAIALEVRGEARARAAVRDLAERGADVIKIAIEPGGGSPILRVDEIRAIVDEAHAHDLDVTAHSASATMPIDGGVDELAHIVCSGASDAILRRMIEREIEIVGTLHVMSGFTSCSAADDMAARFVKLGGELLYGTDVGNAGIPFGIDVDELRLLRAAGLTSERVLAAATSRAGEQVGLEPLGRLEEGAPADVIAVRGDARLLPEDMGRPLVVVRAGRIVVER